MLCAFVCRGRGVVVAVLGGGAELFWWNVWVVPRKVSSLPLAKPSAPLRWGTTADGIGEGGGGGSGKWGCTKGVQPIPDTNSTHAPGGGWEE